MNINGAGNDFSAPILPSIREQIKARKDEANPISFTTPGGAKCRVWLASDKDGNKIIGDDRWWRVNVTAILDQKRERRGGKWSPTPEALNRPIAVVGRNDPIKDMDDALGVLKGFRVRVGIDDEKELQVLGCGCRVVTCQFRGPKVLLHYNGNTACRVQGIHFCEQKTSSQASKTPSRDVEPADSIVRREESGVMEQQPHNPERAIDPRHGSNPDGSTPGALQGDDYPLMLDENGFPELPSCLDRRKPKINRRAA